MISPGGTFRCWVVCFRGLEQLHLAIAELDSTNGFRRRKNKFTNIGKKNPWWEGCAMEKQSRCANAMENCWESHKAGAIEAATIVKLTNGQQEIMTVSPKTWSAFSTRRTGAHG